MLLIGFFTLLSLSSNCLAGWGIFFRPAKSARKYIQHNEFRQFLRIMGFDDASLTPQKMSQLLEAHNDFGKLLSLVDENGVSLLLTDIGYRRLFFFKTDFHNRSHVEAVFNSDLMIPDLPGEDPPFMRIVRQHMDELYLQTAKDLIERRERNIFASIFSFAIYGDKSSPQYIETIKKIRAIGPDLLDIDSSYLSSLARRKAVEMMFGSIERKHLLNRQTLLDWWREARRRGMEKKVDQVINQEFEDIDNRVRSRIFQLIEDEYPDFSDLLYRKPKTPEEVNFIFRIGQSISTEEYQNSQFLQTLISINEIISPEIDPKLYLSIKNKIEKVLIYLNKKRFDDVPPDDLEDFINNLLGYS